MNTKLFLFLLGCLLFLSCSSKEIILEKEYPFSEFIVETDAGEHNEPALPRCNCVKKINMSNKVGFLDGPAHLARFYTIYSVALGENVIYMSDPRSNRIRQFDLKTNMVSTFAGSGIDAGDKGAYKDGPGNQATFHNPGSLAYDKKKRILYVAGENGCRIRAIDRHRVVSTVLPNCGVKGNISDPFYDFPDSGEIAVDFDGNLFMLGRRKGLRKLDFKQKKVLVVCPIGAGDSIKPIDGSLELATFPYSKYLDVTPDGSLWTVGYQSHRIRKIDITNNRVSTIVGTGEADQIDGLGVKAKIFRVFDLAYLNHALYFVDTFDGSSHSDEKMKRLGFYLRKISLQDFSVTTIAGKPWSISRKNFVENGELKNVTLSGGPTHILSDGVETLYLVGHAYVTSVKPNCTCK